MATNITVYHNPRCSKSRQALQLLREQGVEPTIVEYLKEPLSIAQLKELMSVLGGDPHQLVRPKEAPYKEHGLSKTSSPAAIATAIASSPILLERPIAVAGKKAVIGRPPEDVLALLK